MKDEKQNELAANLKTTIQAVATANDIQLLCDDITSKIHRLTIKELRKETVNYLISTVKNEQALVLMLNKLLTQAASPAQKIVKEELMASDNLFRKLLNLQPSDMTKRTIKKWITLNIFTGAKAAKLNETFNMQPQQQPVNISPSIENGLSSSQPSFIPLKMDSSKQKYHPYNDQSKSSASDIIETQQSRKQVIKERVNRGFELHHVTVIFDCEFLKVLHPNENSSEYDKELDENLQQYFKEDVNVKFYIELKPELETLYNEHGEVCKGGECMTGIDLFKYSALDTRNKKNPRFIYKLRLPCRFGKAAQISIKAMGRNAADYSNLKLSENAEQPYQVEAGIITFINDHKHVKQLENKYSEFDEEMKKQSNYINDLYFDTLEYEMRAASTSPSSIQVTLHGRRIADFKKLLTCSVPVKIME